MPRVPVYENTQQQLDTMNPYSSARATAEDFGAGVGQAMMQAGDTLGNMAERLEQEREEEANLNVESKYNNEVFDLLRQADLDYTSTAGGNSVSGYQKANERLNEVRKQVLDGIESPLEKQKMEFLLTKRMNQSKELYGRHRQTQFEVYEEDTFKADLANTAKSASDFQSIPEISDRFTRTGLYQIEQFGEKRGWPPEKVKQFQQDHLDVVYGNIADVKFQQDPQAGASWLADNQGKMSPEIYAKKMTTYKPVLDGIRADAYIQNAVAGLPTQGMEQPVQGAVFDVNKIENSLNEYTPHIKEASLQSGVRESLLAKVIDVESNGNPNAVSPKGAGGVMQIMPATAKELGLSNKDRFNPAKAIPAGARYLGQQITKHGEVLGTAAYNAGAGRLVGWTDKNGVKHEGAISKARKKYDTANPSVGQVMEFMPDETKRYVDKIFNTSGDVLSVGVKTTTRGQSTPPQDAQQNTLPDISTKEGVNSFFARETRKAQQIQDKDVRNKIQAGLNLFKSNQLAIINAQTDADNNVVYSAFNQYMANNNGILDVEKALHSNPQALEAFSRFDEQKKFNILSKKNTEDERMDKELSKKSNVALLQAKAYFSNNPELLKSVDFLSPEYSKNMTREDTLKMVLWKNEQEKSVPTDPLHTNVNQGKAVFNDMWTQFYNKPTAQRILYLADGTPTEDGKLYLFQYGMFMERQKEIQQVNGGKPLTREEQEGIIRDVVVQSKQDVAYITKEKAWYTAGFGSDMPVKKTGTLSDVATSLTAKGSPLEGRNPRDVAKLLIDRSKTGNPADIYEIRDLLNAKKGMNNGK
jgi:soluble lytic murein transglycosylase-like protein